jgi:hypothetical protein
MNIHTAVLLLVLAGFSALSLYAIAEVGYFGIWQAGLAGSGALQLLVDLVIACLLIVFWMVRDARERGLNPWPFVLVTLGGGSFGPLLYLLWREWKKPAPAASLG